MGSDPHPLQIAIQFNEQMKRWDCAVFAGNFESEKAAREYADRLADILRQHFDATFEGRA